MKFNDIPAEIISIRVRPIGSDVAKLEAQPVMAVSACPARPGEFEIRAGDAMHYVKPVVHADIRRLGSELAAGRAMLAQLANPAADGSVELQMAFFTGVCLEMGNVEIGVDEYVQQGTKRIRYNNLDGKRLYSELDDLFSLPHGDQVYFLLLAGPAIDDALKPEPEENPEKAPAENNGPDETEQPEEAASQSIPEEPHHGARPTRKNSFCITGAGIRFVATEKLVAAGKNIFMVTRMTRTKDGPDRALRLARGKLKFVDWTQAGQIQTLTRAQMSELTSDDGSYLKKWDEFGDLEGELLLKQAREIGALHYSGMTENRGETATVSVNITGASDSALDRLAKGGVESLQLVDDLPEYLANPALTFREFAFMLQEEARAGKNEAPANLTVSGFDSVSKSLTLNTEELPPSGMLILSLAGDTAQIKRRMDARRNILEGRAANPQLGLLIEEKGSIAQTRPPHKVKPLTAFVRDKVFKKPPTVRQVDAIETALNTPDIALIQGPPGTGKTTVIAAILERLNEMADKRAAHIRGTVLLTGFQHDAVENMIDRLRLNGLPIPKFGKRSGAEEYGLDLFERDLENWRAEVATKLRARNPQIEAIERESEVSHLALQYNNAPAEALARNLAEKIAALGVITLGDTLARDAANLAKKFSLRRALNDKSNARLEAARRLRHRPDSFADDGPERAADALDDLRDVLEKDERELLDKASLWRTEDGVPAFLGQLAALKRRLLYQFAAPPVFRVEKQNDEIVHLAEEAIKKIRAEGYSAKDLKSAALAEFLAELESNPNGMINAVSDYSFAFAATCQQSVNKMMQKQKGIGKEDSDQQMEYEYVIVDEAARVSPRDLMVPMAQGKRIILVGDHRQLPHIIDDEVARQMEAGEAGEEESVWLKKSMFQYLFSERLKALRDQDGINRCVTLDTQYRMHPLLGDFISRNFYERFDPGERFGSGRPEADFAHNLPDTKNKCAIWLDVPARKGNHRRSGTSWVRPAEATAIVRQLAAWMNSEEGKDLSFGVISFYKAQAELIKGQLGRHTDDDRRLRIGTVDAFQGMEFDVVFLSMVRTVRQNWKPPVGDRQRQARALFGHLCLYNRLNVSMSRQKRLLVVVGDSGLLQGELAAEFIPGLVDFHRLCQTEGRVLA